MTETGTWRILIVDDLPSIHEVFHCIFDPDSRIDLSAEESLLFGDPAPAPAPRFELDSAYHGEEALRKVVTACAAKRPYMLAIVDMRMPPGWDGLQTVERLWEVDENLQIVMCTAYSDISLDDICSRFGTHDHLAFMPKPFNAAEALRLADVLGAKWSACRQ